MNNYQDIIDKIPLVEIDSAIKKMVNNFDLKGNYYGTQSDIYNPKHWEKLFRQFFTITSELSDIIEKRAKQEYEEKI